MIKNTCLAIALLLPSKGSHAYLCPDLTPDDITYEIMLEGEFSDGKSEPSWSLSNVHVNGNYSLLVLSDASTVKKIYEEAEEKESRFFCTYIITDHYKEEEQINNRRIKKERYRFFKLILSIKTENPHESDKIDTATSAEEVTPKSTPKNLSHYRLILNRRAYHNFLPFHLGLLAPLIWGGLRFKKHL